jgi:hypothetical protein
MILTGFKISTLQRWEGALHQTGNVTMRCTPQPNILYDRQYKLFFCSHMCADTCLHRSEHMIPYPEHPIQAIKHTHSPTF